MELWIRSQDKKCLTKVNHLYTNDNCEIKQQDDIILGTYKNQERALEVLDEIQSILKPKVIVNTYKVEQAQLCDGTEFIQPMLDNIQVQSATTYVYEMPKD